MLKSPRAGQDVTPSCDWDCSAWRKDLGVGGNSSHERPASLLRRIKRSIVPCPCRRWDTWPGGGFQWLQSRLGSNLRENVPAARALGQGSRARGSPLRGCLGRAGVGACWGQVRSREPALVQGLDKLTTEVLPEADAVACSGQTATSGAEPCSSPGERSRAGHGGHLCPMRCRRGRPKAGHV